MKNMKNMEMKLEMEPLPPRFRLQAAKVRCYPPFTSSKEGGAVPCLALPCLATETNQAQEEPV